jgi:hypothetical protein
MAVGCSEKFIQEVNVFDLTIIYLALGAPLGVYHVATHWEGPALSTFSLSILNIFLWPIAALVFARGHLKNVAVPTVTLCVARLNDAASACLPVGQAFEFRDSLDTYVGLSEALESEIGTSAVDELASIANLGDLVVARAVARRTNREKLLRRRDAARIELLTWLKALRTADVATAAAELAGCLADHAAVDKILALSSSLPTDASVRPDRLSIAA